ncbi:MAG: hypothetical protein M3451_00950, partial [Chloroflexota bacterium]|nr:hypothetical protein [Chloroflexota bacterium]
PQTWPRIQLIANRLKGERAIRPRGKEYDLLVVSYFADLWQVVRNISQHVAKGAPVVLVLGDSAPYGIHVDTPALLTALSAELGFDHVETATLRRRGLRWQSNGSRHSVDLHERMVVLRSPGGH